MKKKNIPNILTIGRGVMTVGIVVMFYLEFKWKFSVILGLFVLATLSDFADGFLARRWKVVSNFGVVFDSMFDKVLILALMMLLIPYQLLPVGVWVLFLIRELVVDSLKSYLAAQKTPLSPIKTGKYKMVAEVALVIICLVRLTGDTMFLKISSEVAAITGLILAYYSALIYIKKLSFAKI